LSWILSVTSLAFALVISNASASEFNCACAASYLVRAAKKVASCFWNVVRALLWAVWALASSWEELVRGGNRSSEEEEVMYLDRGFLNLL